MFGRLTARVGTKYGVSLPLVLNSALQLAPCTMWNNEFRDGFKAWWAAGHKVTPMKLLYTGLGSIEDPFNMTNCEKMLNSMKARVSCARLF